MFDTDELEFDIYIEDMSKIYEFQLPPIIDLNNDTIKIKILELDYNIASYDPINN